MGRRQAPQDTVAASKTCRLCGRSISWRKKWAEQWDEVRYCSSGCRRQRLNDVDRALERSICELLDGRARGATICPSEAARTVSGAPDDPTVWRPLMERARAAGRRLVVAGDVEFLQRGHVVDPSTAKGPVRLRRIERPVD